MPVPLRTCALKKKNYLNLLGSDRGDSSRCKHYGTYGKRPVCRLYPSLIERFSHRHIIPHLYRFYVRITRLFSNLQCFPFHHHPSIVTPKFCPTDAPQPKRRLRTSNSQIYHQILLMMIICRRESHPKAISTTMTRERIFYFVIRKYFYVDNMVLDYA